MAYNPQTAISKIYNLKGLWETANNSGDTKKKNDAAAKAQEYYKQLRDNGYTDVADELTASNYTQAKAINDKWAKTGKTSTRDYMYSLGKSRGMSESDIDKLISWDNQSGEVSFGGKKIGAPDAVVDGVSYWADTSVLDNAFNDYISRSGTTRSKSVAVDQENENLFAKYKQHYDNAMNTNPFTTEEAKAILAKYDLAGLQGRDNAVAENAPSNGGNIDSFAAANALRQQASLVNQGQMAVLDAHKQKLDHARALLSDMGVNIDRVFNQDETIKNREFNQKEAYESRIWEQNETSKNNDVARKSEIAAVTGTVPDEWVVSNNPYLNDDGTIKDEFKNTDFSAVMAKAKETGNTELYNAAATARFYKIMGNYGLYGQYDDGNYIVPEKQKTEAAKQNEETLSKAQYSGNSASVNLYKPSLTAAQARDAIKAGEISQSVIDAYNYYYGTKYTVDNPPKLTETEFKVPLSEDEVTSWVDYLNSAFKTDVGSEEYTALELTGKNKYSLADAEAAYIIRRVFDSSDLSQEQKEYLIYDKFGITEDQVNAVLRDPHYKD